MKRVSFVFSTNTGGKILFGLLY